MSEKYPTGIDQAVTHHNDAHLRDGPHDLPCDCVSLYRQAHQVSTFAAHSAGRHEGFNAGFNNGYSLAIQKAAETVRVWGDRYDEADGTKIDELERLIVRLDETPFDDCGKVEP